MKKKLILGIVAATLALSLAVGGTLMLFTDTSGPATNVVTLGNVGIALQEYIGKNGNDDVYATIGDALPGEGTYTKDDSIDTLSTKDDKFSGINFGGAVVPGDTLYKRPRVVNTGANDAYVKVEGELTIEIPNDNLTALNDKYGSSAKIAETLAKFVSFNDGSAEGYEGAYWYGTSFVASDIASGWKAGAEKSTLTLSGTWYYAEDVDGKTQLVKLPTTGEDAKTVDIFDTVKFGKTVGEEFEGIELSIELIAHAVQVDNNEFTAPTDGDYIKAFESVFTTPVED
jgi:hypothetical protein